MKTLLSLFLSLAYSLLAAQVIPIADMNSPRQVHQATALPNGDVLVTGGEGDGDYWSTAERWDAAADQWFFVDDMSSVRWGHTATLLDNGKVLVTGGWDGQNANHMNTELFNADLNVWEDGPDMSVGRSNQRAVKLSNGHVLIGGGYNGVEDQVSCDIYNPEDNSISPTGDLNFGRSSFSLTLLDDGRVLAVGGFNPNFDFQMDEAEIYDPATGEWTEVESLDQGTDNHAALLLPNGDVMIIGGRLFNGDLNWFEGNGLAWIYDLADDSWLQMATNTGQSYVDAYNFGGMVLVPGGANITGAGVDNTLSPTEEYTFDNELWAISTSWMAEGRYRYASCQLPNGEVVVCGGEDDASAERYDLSVGVDEANPQGFEVFPNPSNHELNVVAPFSEYAIEIRNSRGELIRRLQEQTRQKIVVVDLTPGLYFVTVISGSQRLTEPWVKQ